MKRYMSVVILFAGLAFGQDQCNGKFRVAICIESSQVSWKPRVINGEQVLPWNTGFPLTIKGYKNPCFSSDADGKKKLATGWDRVAPRTDTSYVWLNESTKFAKSCKVRQGEEIPATLFMFYEARIQE